MGTGAFHVAIWLWLTVVPYDQPPAAIPAAQPVIPVDDLRSDGPVARYVLELSTAAELIVGPSPNVELYTTQLKLGPDVFSAMLGDVLGGLDNYSLRVRNNMIQSGTDVLAGPMTFALQRIYPSEQLSISSFLNIHAGIQMAFATPWLAGRTLRPPVALQSVNAVDTELAQNGWSLRPFGFYLRADLAVCRNIYLETGAEPEAFVPTAAGATAEADLRWHFNVGFSLDCRHGADSWNRHLAALIEYRGQARLYSASAPPDADHAISVALQYDWNLFTVGAFFMIDPGSGEYQAVGLRLQVGFFSRTDQ